MSYVHYYSKCIRYGRAPAETVHNLMSQSPANGTFDPHNNSDMAVLDFLQDHEDPRAEIVQRDLQYRDTKNDNIIGFHNRMRELLGLPTVEFSTDWQSPPNPQVNLEEYGVIPILESTGHRLEINKYRHSGNKRVVYHIGYTIPSKSGSGYSNPQTVYDNALSESEYHALINRLRDSGLIK